MEILLELDCGLDVEFTPDWVSTENHSDHTKVQWELSNSSNKGGVDDVFIELSPEESFFESRNYLEGSRLLYRCDS